MLGFSDLWTFGDSSNSWILNSLFPIPRQSNAAEPFASRAGDSKYICSIFFPPTPAATSLEISGKPRLVPGYNSFTFKQKYTSAGTNLAKQFGAPHHQVWLGLSKYASVKARSRTIFSRNCSRRIDDFNTVWAHQFRHQSDYPAGRPDTADNIVKCA